MSGHSAAKSLYRGCSWKENGLKFRHVLRSAFTTDQSAIDADWACLHPPDLNPPLARSFLCCGRNGAAEGGLDRNSEEGAHDGTSRRREGDSDIQGCAWTGRTRSEGAR